MMKQLLILGAGTAGTMVANKLRPRLSKDVWQITIVDQEEIHYYQPGFLFIPFGLYDKHDVVKAKSRFIPDGVEMITDAGGKLYACQMSVDMFEDMHMLHEEDI